MIVVQANPETIVKVEPYTSTAGLGGAFAVNISVVDVQNLYGFEVALSWNASVLNVASLNIRLGVESYPDGVLHESVYTVENSLSQDQGKYLLAAVSLAPASSFNGSGVIVIVTFNVVGYGDSKLDLESKLYDYAPPDREPRISLPIEHTTIDGLFVIPEFSNTFLLLLFMILMLPALFLSKKVLTKTNLRLPQKDIPRKVISIGQNLLDRLAG